jgi:L-amino acid N-acyltransferase YncA
LRYSPFAFRSSTECDILDQPFEALSGESRTANGERRRTTDMSTLQIVPMTEQHWPAVREIFAQGIATGNATFETIVPEWAEWDARHLPTCRLLALRDDEVLGWAALCPVSLRQAYRGVAEVSVYIAESARGTGVGSALLASLIAESEHNSIWTLQATIFAENPISIHLHEKTGFRIVGRRERIGCLHGRWLDTVLLERRSEVVGR